MACKNWFLCWTNSTCIQLRVIFFLCRYIEMFLYVYEYSLTKKKPRRNIWCLCVSFYVNMNYDNNFHSSSMIKSKLYHLVLSIGSERCDICLWYFGFQITIMYYIAECLRYPFASCFSSFIFQNWVYYSSRASSSKSFE